MPRPRITSEWLSDRLAPRCPHCDGCDMDFAAISLGDLCLYTPLDEFIAVDGDGYAAPERHLELLCPDCNLPSALRISRERVFLVACRTKTDLRYLETRFGAVDLAIAASSP